MNPSPLTPSLPASFLTFRLTEGVARDFFYPGETLPVQLLQMLDSQKALVQIKGKSFLSELPGTFPGKGEFLVRVEQVEPKVILRLLPPVSSGTDPLAVNLKALLVEDLPLEGLVRRWENLMRLESGSLPRERGETVAAIQKAMSAIAGAFQSRSPEEALQQLIAFSGLNWENQLKKLIDPESGSTPDPAALPDLKGLLVKLKAQWASDASEWTREIQPLLNKLELGQLLNAVESPKDQLLLFFPLWFPAGCGWSEMLLSGEGSGPEGQYGKGKTLLFLLHLPELGKLRIEVRVWERQIYCQFKTADPEVDVWLTGQLPRLRAGLTSLGYSAEVGCQVVGREELGDSLLPRMAGFPDSLVSLVV